MHGGNDDWAMQEEQTWTARQIDPRNSFGLAAQLIFMMRLKDVMLDGVLESMPLPVEEKTKYRAALKSQNQFRDDCGYAIGVKSADSPCKKSAFLAGSSKAGEKLFLYVSALVYGQNVPLIIQDHVENKRSAKDSMKLEPLLSTFTQFKETAAEDEALTEAAEKDKEYEQESGDLILARGSGQKTKTVNKDDDPQNVFLGPFLHGIEIWSKGLSVQLVKKIKTFRNQCAHAVDRDCEYVVVHPTEESEDGIATKFRQQDRINNNGVCRTAIVYETTVVGVSQSNPSSNITPSRK